MLSVSVASWEAGSIQDEVRSLEASSLVSSKVVCPNKKNWPDWKAAQRGRSRTRNCRFYTLRTPPPGAQLNKTRPSDSISATR